ncbi:conserved hypothetical protein [Hyella patelloides LEGE 07179]|uniref:Uncharacterized protein n=1 Tax=Hyella patelloides LEGE 07179 TaxID=945734 RepID=A0A563VQ68_9CYAN|nr:DUF416 family protein [Hyella patelloides]VEP13550.1 conserved hypothetical protein [Hyella patelloides LEGE 07179]
MKLKYSDEGSDIDLIVSEIKKNPLAHQIAFAASICERLLPNYRIFARETNWKTYPVLRQALDEVWSILRDNSIDSIDSIRFNKLLTDCDNVVPHTHDSSSAYNHEAQIAATCVCYLIEMCLQKEPVWETISSKQTKKLEFQSLIKSFIGKNGIVPLKRLIYNTYDSFYQYIDWQMSEAEEKIYEDWSQKTWEERKQTLIDHPLTVREMKKENEDLQLLKETPKLTPEFVRQFRNSALEYTNGKSLFDLG